jgi:hypothetical protein
MTVQDLRVVGRITNGKIRIKGRIKGGA